MPTLFRLDIVAEGERAAALRLCDAGGRVLVDKEITLTGSRRSQWEGLFDTRGYVRRMAKTDRVRAASLLDKLGLFLGRDVLGGDMMRELEGEHRRTLLVRLPDTSSSRLAAAFGRVPWEIARAEPGGKTLLERNVVVRAGSAGAPPSPDVGVPLMKGEAVRVLLIFAETPGSQPLAARLERERLRKLFFDDVLPYRNVEVDVLCHGVTRGRIREQIKGAAGYHVVHWSGHGHHSVLEIEADAGEEPRITGAELVRLFAEAGGFIPRLFFLSACHSGSLMHTREWAELLAALGARGRSSKGSSPAPALEALLERSDGFTGTALELLRAGVRGVAAMRYEVDDRYARRLARRFYKHLLADPALHPADAALALARTELAGDTERATEYHPVDHATPIFFGEGDVRIAPHPGRSLQMDRKSPRPQPLLRGGGRDLDPPHDFVGRSRELARLAREWVAPDKAPIALLQGLAGLGKTSLAAEAIHLWHRTFDYVFAFQMRGAPLPLDELYLQLDQRLMRASAAYRARCGKNEMAAVYMPPRDQLSGEEREEVLQNNLIDSLFAERILIVLDNVETNLSKLSGPNGHESHDPAWDRLFKALEERLQGSGSRVLITSRHRIAALRSPDRVAWLPLGPLSMADAALFFEGNPPLRRLLFGDGEAKQLAARILAVSRGHPLILGRLSNMARMHLDDGLRPEGSGRAALHEALNRIQAKGYGELPNVIAGTSSNGDRERERRYLEEVLVNAVDELLKGLSADARRLLWTVTRSAEPASERLLDGVWSGLSLEAEVFARELAREIDELSAAADHLPPEVKAEYPDLPGGFRDLKDGVGWEIASLRPALDALCGAGLLVRDGEDRYAFHEIVAERAAAWMNKNQLEQGGRTEADIHKAFGERYSDEFRDLLSRKKREAAVEAGRRGIRHLVLAGEIDMLLNFANDVIVQARAPALLNALMIDLHAARKAVPPGKARWTLDSYLANALLMAGRTEQAAGFFWSAVKACTAAEDWADASWICLGCARALSQLGRPARARTMFTQAADAARRAGSPRAYVISAELEALRIDIAQGRVRLVLPQIEEKIQELHLSVGELLLSGAPDEPFDATLVQSIIDGLGVAEAAYDELERANERQEIIRERERVARMFGVQEEDELTLKEMEGALRLVELAAEDAERDDRAEANRKLSEAQTIVERCLEVFRQQDDLQNEGRALSALASVWEGFGDIQQAAEIERQALAVYERLPDPADRADSHHNIAYYLTQAEQEAEAINHGLAAYIYRVASRLGVRASVQLLAGLVHASALSGGGVNLPRLQELISHQDFMALRQFLATRNIETLKLESVVAKLRDAINRSVDKLYAKIAAESWEFMLAPR